MSVVEAVRRDLAALPEELAGCGLAASALALARALDGPETTAAEVASCARALQVTLDRLRELAPPEEKKDGLDDLSARRATRLAGKSTPAHQRGS